MIVRDRNSIFCTAEQKLYRRFSHFSAFSFTPLHPRNSAIYFTLTDDVSADADRAVMFAKVIKLCSITPLERLNAPRFQHFPLPPLLSLSATIAQISVDALSLRCPSQIWRVLLWRRHFEDHFGLIHTHFMGWDGSNHTMKKVITCSLQPAQ